MSCITLSIGQVRTQSNIGKLECIGTICQFRVSITCNNDHSHVDIGHYIKKKYFHISNQFSI